MISLRTVLKHNDITSLKEFLNTISVLDHEQLCFVAKTASPEALELCLPFTKPHYNQSEVLVWSLKNTANPTRAYDVFCVLRNHCNVLESIGMLENEWSDELFVEFDQDEERITEAQKTLIEWEARAQKSALAQCVGLKNKKEGPARRM